MDDSGITQDLSMLSEPSLSTREGKGAQGVARGGREGGGPASWHSQRGPGAPQLQCPTAPVFRNASHLWEGLFASRWDL